MKVTVTETEIDAAMRLYRDVELDGRAVARVYLEETTDVISLGQLTSVPAPLRQFLDWARGAPA